MLYTSPNHPPVPDHLPALVSRPCRGSSCVFTYPWPLFPFWASRRVPRRKGTEQEMLMLMLMLMLLMSLRACLTDCHSVRQARADPVHLPGECVTARAPQVAGAPTASDTERHLTRIYAPLLSSTPTTTERTTSSPHHLRAISAWQSSFPHLPRLSGQAEARASRRAAMEDSRGLRCAQSSVKRQGTSSGPSQIRVS